MTPLTKELARLKEKQAEEIGRPIWTQVSLDRWVNLISALEVACAEINSLKGAHELIASNIENVSTSIYGDLHGCDCEGICGCKPLPWCELQTIKYHSMGSAIGIDDTLDKITKLIVGES